MIKKIAILTSGGDCAGLNAVIRAVTLRANSKYNWDVYGIKDGTLGLLKDPLDILKLEPNNKIALEYQGELFLALGQMGKALNNLRLLKSQCQLGCLELTQLKAAIDKF